MSKVDELRKLLDTHTEARKAISAPFDVDQFTRLRNIDHRLNAAMFDALPALLEAAEALQRCLDYLYGPQDDCCECCGAIDHQEPREEHEEWCVVPPTRAALEKLA